MALPPRGKGEASLFAPPLAEVEQFEETVVGVGELALVDDEAGFVLAGGDCGNDLVEGGLPRFSMSGAKSLRVR